MVDGFWITLFGTGGKLDARFVRTESEVATTLANLLLKEWTVINGGDKITIEAGESEQE